MSEQSSANQGQSVVTKILDLNLQRKHNLNETHDDIIHLADELKHEQNIIQELKTEFGNFKREIPNSKVILLEEECPIIIAGGPSVGKSSFINLLIGSDILPVSLLPCTSTITKIHNSPKKEIRVTDYKGNKKIIEFGHDEASRSIHKEVRKYVTIEEEDSKCKSVDIYFPVPLLKENTVIVDTPFTDVSGTTELNALLLDVLSNAGGFICIIDANFLLSDIGARSHEMLGLHPTVYEALRKFQQREILIESTVSRTMFVCNKWDMIYEDEEECWNYIKDKLRQNWPNFHEKQLFQLSVREERALAKQKKISINYQKLQLGIDKLVRCSLEAGAVMKARWQKDFLTAMIDKTVGSFKLLEKSERDKKELIHTTEQGQRILLIKIAQVEERVIKNAEFRCAELSKKIYVLLQNQETKNKLLQLKHVQSLFEPYPIGCIDKMEQRSRGLEIIHHHIENELRIFWKKERIEKPDSDIRSMLLNGAELFNEQSEQIRRLLLQYKVPDGKHDQINKINPEMFRLINEWYDEILLRYYSEREIYGRFESKYMKPFKQKFRHVSRNNIQQQVKSDSVFIMNLTTDSRTYKEPNKLYISVGEKAKVIMGKLLIICKENFSHETVETANLRNSPDEQKWEGQFAKVRSIEMLHGQTWIKAVVKTMKQPLNNDVSFTQLAELDSLRNINHPNIIQIYGTSIKMVDERNKYLKVYMEQCTESLMNLVLQNRNFVPCGKLQNWNTDESKKSKEIYTKIMLGVLTGLAHLHEEGFAHRDLKMSNIFVKDEVAKLADTGLVQQNGHTCTAIGPNFPTTVAPEVFIDSYSDDAESDIYSIGILMWELYYCRPAFTSVGIEDSESKSVQKKEYTFEVKDAQELIDRVHKGYRPAFETYKPVSELQELITKCWSADTGKRPTAKIVAIEIEEIFKR